MHLIIYGPEGSGKGTQAKLLSEKLKLPIITSGDLVREAAENNKGKLGDTARKALSSGSYVPDREMFQLWKDMLALPQSRKGFILDGFPRNITQGEFILSETEKYGYTVDCVIYLNLSNSEAIKRLSRRHRKLFAGSNINHDDPKRVKQRLEIYRSSESALLSYFMRKKMVVEINADQRIEDVFSDILRGISLSK